MNDYLIIVDSGFSVNSIWVTEKVWKIVEDRNKHNDDVLEIARWIFDQAGTGGMLHTKELKPGITQLGEPIGVMYLTTDAGRLMKHMKNVSRENLPISVMIN